MKFLESLYSIENFGIYLFVVIGILVVLFLVILFFGKKDEKKRKEESTGEVNTFAETSTPTPLEVAVEPQNVNADIAPIEHTPLENNFNSLPVQPEEISSIPAPQEEVVPEKEFDFDALAAAISKELESIDSTPVSEPKKEEFVSEVAPIEPVAPILPREEEPISLEVTPEPIIKEEPKVVLNPVIEEEPKIEIPSVSTTIEKTEEKKVMPRPAVFSSVYVNRNVEEPKMMEEQKQVSIPEVAEVKEEVVPVAPKIELPRMMDLPKKK